MHRTSQDILDDVLVLESQGGDRRAMGLLVERWHPRLLRHAHAQLGREANADPQLASDITQDAWVLVIRKIHTLDDPARFGAWALRIVTNRCRDHQRRTRRRPPVASSATDDLDHTRTAPAAHAPSDPETGLHGETGESERARLFAALRALRPEARGLIALRFRDRLSVPQIARVLGVPAGTVKSRLHTATARLREVLTTDRGRGPPPSPSPSASLSSNQSRPAATPPGQAPPDRSTP